MASKDEAEFRFRKLAGELGWPLADNECPHGNLAHDIHVPCACFAIVQVGRCSHCSYLWPNCTCGQPTIRRESECSSAPSQSQTEQKLPPGGGSGT